MRGPTPAWVVPAMRAGFAARAVVFGQSMGGRSTTFAAAKNPGRVAALALIDYTPDNAPGGSVSVQVSYPFAFVALGFLPLAPVSLGSTAKTIVSG